MGAMDYATLVWVDWFYNRRLFGPICDVPPAEFEQECYRQQQSQAKAA
jgi:putative transposase